MLRFSFRKGLRFFQGTRSWEVNRRLATGHLQLEGEDGALWNIKESELLGLLRHKDLAIDTESLGENNKFFVPIPRDLSSYSERLQEKARWRQAYIQRLLSWGTIVSTPRILRPMVDNVAKALQDPKPPSPESVYRWYKRYLAGQSIILLVDRNERKGRKQTMCEEVQTIVDNAINTVYLHHQRFPAKRVCEEIERQIRHINQQRREDDRLKCPSTATLYRYLKRLEPYAVDASRLGKKAADQTYRGVFGVQKAEHILDRCEIDHTPVDLLVFSEEASLVLGRPWLTILLDKSSRLILGFYISFGNPSAYGVLQCLKQAILPKDEILSRYQDITTSWPAKGLPMVLVCDNGMEAHSGDLTKVCEELGIQLQFCPAKKPEYKGSIERFFRTINQDLFHQLPGTVFSNPNQRGNYDAEKLSVISFSNLVHLVTKWIVEIYHQTPHRGIGMPPIKKWELGLANRIVEHPAQPEQMEVIMGRAATRILFHYGVEHHGIRYNSPELQMIRRRQRGTIEISLKYYDDDLDYIYAFDPLHKEYIRVEAIDRDYTDGLTLDLHRRIRQSLRADNEQTVDREKLLAKKQEMQQLVQAAMRHKKMAVRKLSSISKGLTSASVLAKPTVSPPLPASAEKPNDLSALFQDLAGEPLPMFVVRTRQNSDNENSAEGGLS